MARAVAVFLVVGCSAKGTEKVTEGSIAAQHSVEAELKAQGDVPAAGETAPIPSLVPGEGHVQLPIPAVPATAPPPDKFDNDDAGHLLARCRDRSARHEWFDAIGDCRRSAELNPAWIEPHVELMRLLITLQSYADAEESARKVLAVRPDDAVALYYLAWSYRGREQYPKAVEALQRAIAIDPKRAEFVQALGVTYCLSENYGKGIATLERAVAMQPADEKSQHALASARALLKDRLEPYRKLVKEKPDSYDNHAALGFMYQKYGLSQQALKSYDTSLQMIPAPLEKQDAETKKLAAQIYYNRGVVYRDLGRPEIAEPAFVKARQVDPSLSSFAWYYIGLCRADAGKYEASIEALQQSVELAPDVADNRLALADSFEKAGKTSLAIEQRNAVAAIEARAAAEKAAAAKVDADLIVPAKDTPPATASPEASTPVNSSSNTPAADAAAAGDTARP